MRIEQRKGPEIALKPLFSDGGRYWFRTNDPCRVKAGKRTLANPTLPLKKASVVRYSTEKFAYDFRTISVQAAAHVKSHHR